MGLKNRTFDEEGNKPRKKKKRKKKNYLLRLFLLIVIGVSLYFLFSSEIFDVSAIVVENNKYYTQEQLIDMSGAKIGGNIFEAKTATMKEKLIKNSYVENATVKRRFPGTIVISVTEREEATAIPFGGQFIIIDKKGLVLRISDVEPKLTLLMGLTVKKNTLNKPLEVEQNAILTDTLSMLDKMDKDKLYFKMVDISNVVIKAYVLDNLICEGTPENILANLENGNLEKVLYDCYTKGIERGTIKVGSDGFVAFSPMGV